MSSIKETEFIDDILNKLSEVSKIKNINRGGCAIVSHALYEYIKCKYPEKKPEIVYMYVSKLSVIVAIRGKRLISCEHSLILIDNRYYDADGIHERKDIIYNCLTEGIKIHDDEVLWSIREGNDWNDSFNRDDAPLINKIFGTTTDYSYKKD